ncbi:alpha-L-rhamnosidase [Mucilaginibacter ginsenosidivorax]|uniref:alpha-L-rhamnosidase n=1 Tax=Mucilaginibacter ginsenosidivorax TaxID=862126 RepID=A0A5B8VY33_9SPHI|nr:alpha-L-rhamnosidase [Mucilaginibacter ginsenosidivorax]QEC75198.1 Bacterial alpha-L-rhamnosidase [Mucilaginibacter ginsenosidivorax]
MKKIICLLINMLLIVTSSVAQLSVYKLLTENRTNPIGLDETMPRFSWQLSSSKRNVFQAAYQIQVFTSAKGKVFWDSGKVLTSESVFVPYAGSPLQSGKPYFWVVKVWDNYNKKPAVSDTASFRMAFLNVSDWKAKWIEPGYTEDSVMRPSPLFRKVFLANKKILSAIAYITAHGLYEAQINGVKIGDAYFTPGWTSYNKRLQYQVYDVTNMVAKGNNAITATLGNGWYRGIIGFKNKENMYGNDIALLFQLEITYADGTTSTITSDDSWKSSTGSILYSQIYNGETIDAGCEKKGWMLPGYDDTRWASVKVTNHPMNILVATVNEPIREKECFKPAKIFTTPAGEHVVDFGQNLAGWVTLKVNGKKGDKIIVSHAEVLDKDGNFYTANLRAAKAQDTYILKGGGEESFKPHFTWHGFRYIKVEGYPGELKPENFTATALYSDIPPAGTFSSSNALINQLQHNIQWGQKSNFIDVPTDCPQRDERLGWTGDAQVFFRTAAFNMNVDNFFTKWLKDVSADQLPNGSVPFVIPDVLGQRRSGSAGWDDAACIVPWNLYVAYGNKRVLEQQYPGMKKWVEFIRNSSHNNLWNTGIHYGDWLFYSPDDDRDGKAAVTDKFLIAQCFYANSIQLLINAARVLGNKEDIPVYEALLANVKQAFVKEYVTATGRLVSGTQTAYVLALNFDMLPDELRQQAAVRLVENIISYGNHLTTGFLGTPYLCHVLSRFGYADIAYKLLLQQDYPSWLYPVKMGATTVWERWDGIKPDSTFESPAMNSFNHYSYGAIGDWMYRVMAGLDSYDDGPGYKHIKIQPHIGGGFTNASAALQTYYGKLSSSWVLEKGKVLMDVEIPANTTATVFVPANSADEVTESGAALTSSTKIEPESGYVVLTLGSGIYHFVVSEK